ncbi:tRNA pseudouridine synthase Pus10-like [Artemia franciscana]|uniref:tRNA pseudouridine(55) synthase n=1 Tax=Artemia franciscana TaxID=6661 RepID=A0AA88LC56_ARTSF|nr:hypothetical protein QYM36_004077 [Artemia franciscana]KAK2720040.1 hypothetical protein QYM36_004077 [Artemia franciscana]KAK2720041.1 hypothetical protein QYM36_004077 [Artemia franciscana]KAK2720042.1 hypothetical protein QYM36_004077 [Artemia franciscana]KAK2720043.1 hypothetical protein QYM36_004077 [Artemia franciscana]
MVSNSDTINNEDDLPESIQSRLCEICYFRIWERNNFTSKVEDYFLSKKTEVGDEKPGKHIKTNPCCLCFGLLTLPLLEQSILLIKQILNNDKYKQDLERKQCCLSFSIPPAIFIREAVLKVFIKDKYEGLLDFERKSAFITIKESWRTCLEQLANDLKFDDNNPLRITVTALYIDNNEECKQLSHIPGTYFPNANKKSAGPEYIYSRASVLNAIGSISEEDLKKNLPFPPSIPQHFATLTASGKHDSVFIAGRYNKYSRNLSQTPWTIDGVRKSDLSVDELLSGPIKSVFRAEHHNFSSSGREDVDVRMLGSGRPFIVELIDPGLSDILFEKMRSIECDINNSSLVKVRDLQIISKNEIKNLKEGEEEKKKTYKALCITKQVPAPEAIMKIQNSERLVLEQKTPIRVLHRRPLAIRKRAVENIKLTKVPKETQDFLMYELEVTTQAGTYVKEFVHGDFGRTNPNLSDLLGIEMDIVALDVLNIEIDWPPALNQ